MMTCNITIQSLPMNQAPTTRAVAPSTSPMSSEKVGSNYWASRSKHAKKLLPPYFTPTDYSVVCGRTKFCFDSVGNRRFRVTVKMFLDEYAEANGKQEKSKIVTKVYNLIRAASPEGAFVTYENGNWYECSQRIAREKIGAMFRDFLHESYRSSAKSKQAARKNSMGSSSSSSSKCSKTSVSETLCVSDTPSKETKQPPKECFLEPNKCVEPSAFPGFFDVDDMDTKQPFPLTYGTSTWSQEHAPPHTQFSDHRARK